MLWKKSYELLYDFFFCSLFQVATRLFYEHALLVHIEILSITVQSKKDKESISHENHSLMMQPLLCYLQLKSNIQRYQEVPFA